MVNEIDDNTIRISRTHTPAFYTRASTQFLQGVTGKDGEAKKIYDDIVISALGAAIPTAAQVAGTLEKNDVGSITKVQTSYTELEFGKRPQVLITVKRNPKYVAPPESETNKGKKGKTSTTSSSSNKSKTSVKAKQAFADGPKCPERLENSKLEKKMGKVRKEGGKRGVEIEGQADMGGLKYFCTKVLEPAGDLDMLVESVKAMNAKSDPSEEERKGGSGKIGKVVMSMAEQNDLCIVAYVPADSTEFDADEWLKLILAKCGVPSVAKGGPPLREDSNPVYAQIHIKNDEAKGIYALKLRDYVIQHANGVLTEKGLIPEIEDDEDEMVFGDDDFDM